MTRRRIKRLYRDAERAWTHGYYQAAGGYGPQPAPARGPLRLAYDAGVENGTKPSGVAIATKEYGPEYPSACQHLPLDVWMRVLAEETRRGIY